MNHLKRTVNKFEEMAVSQEEKGMEKYGKPIDPLDDYDWLEMADEEMVDGYKYLHAEKIKRKFIVDKIRKLTECEEIHYWLNQLEGEIKWKKQEPPF